MHFYEDIEVDVPEFLRIPVTIAECYDKQGDFVAYCTYVNNLYSVVEKSISGEFITEWKEIVRKYIGTN